MNSAHLHLVLNHLPVLGIPFGVALLAASLGRLNVTLQRAGLVVLVLGGCAAALAFLTGEPAEAALERLAIHPEAAVETHEEAATIGLLAASTVGLLALAGWWRTRRSVLRRGPVVVLLLVGLLASGTLAWVANLGGRIRHSELGGAPTLTRMSESDEER